VASWPLLVATCIAVAMEREMGRSASGPNFPNWQLAPWWLATAQLLAAYAYHRWFRPGLFPLLTVSGALWVAWAAGLMLLGKLPMFAMGLACWLAGLLVGAVWLWAHNDGALTKPWDYQRKMALFLLLAGCLAGNFALQTLGVALVALGVWSLVGLMSHPGHVGTRSTARLGLVPSPWMPLLAGALALLLFRCLSSWHSAALRDEQWSGFYVLTGLIFGYCVPGILTPGRAGPLQLLVAALSASFLVVVLGVGVVPGLLGGLLLGTALALPQNSQGHVAVALGTAAVLVLWLEPLLLLGEMPRQQKVMLLGGAAGVICLLVAAGPLLKRGRKPA